MKPAIKKFLFTVIILTGLFHYSYSQSRDSARFKNPATIPDTQRIPPHRSVPEDSSSKKLQGGALIDTVTTKKRVRYQKGIDDRMDTLKPPKH